jgi:hypothetical protein
VRVRILVPVAVIAVVAGSALYATQVTSMSTRRVVRGPYTTTEVLEFLLFSTGRVVADHPGLDKQRALTKLPDAQARGAVESVTRCVHHIDAAAGPALTAAFNAADPQRLDGALHRFDAAARQWISAPYKQDDPCPPPPPPPYEGPMQEPGQGWWRVNGDVDTKYVVFGTDFYAFMYTVGGAFAVSFVGLVAELAVVALGLLLVPEFITYEFENTPTELDRQTAIAKLASELRS